MTLRRGFRAEAERIALSIRADLGLTALDPLPLERAASERGIRVVSAADLVPIEQLVDLERIQAFAFSACTFDIHSHRTIVFNPLRSQPRQRSDVAHELSHLLLEHELTEVREVGGVPFRTCRADQEEEATTLGGTLLLPRPLVVHAVGRRMSIEDIARRYGVTEDMARFRVNTTGAARQIDSRRSSLSAQRGPSTT